jgi:hypothetical protein
LAAFAAMVAVLIGLIVYADFIQAKLLRVLTYRFYVIKESRWPQAVAAILLLIAVGGYVILKYDMLVRTDDEDDTVMCNGAFYYIRLAVRIVCFVEAAAILFTACSLFRSS